MVVVKIISVLAAIIIAVLITALFTKNKYTLQREITINKPKQEVFDFIKLNRNQHLYSKWLSFDPNTKIEIRGTGDGTAGSILAFESSNHKTGKGEWETKKVTQGERIDFELRFLEPFAFTANGHFLTTAVSENQTTLTWIYNSGMDWPMNFMLLFMDMDELVGNDMAESLQNAKSVLEKN